MLILKVHFLIFYQQFSKWQVLSSLLRLGGIYSYEDALEAMRIINEGTDQEVARFGLQHSAKTYCQIISGQATLLNVGSCTEISRVADASDSSIYIGWKDPVNLVLNESPLAIWDHTELWRAEGTEPPAYPGAPGCVLITQTDRLGIHNIKDSFCSTAYKDTTTESGVTYTYKLFSYTTTGNYNNLSGNVIPDVTTWTVGLIHTLSQAGTLLNFMPIGEMFTFNHALYGELTGVLMDYDAVQATNPALHPHTAIIQTLDCVFTAPFDSPEDAYALTEDTTALATKTYYELSGTSYVATSSLQTGDDIPALTYYEKNPNTSNGNGTNKACESNLLQNLNAEVETNWFVKKNLWDKCNYTSRKGFFWGLEQSLKDCIVPVNRTEIQANGYGGRAVTKSYKVFLPFIREIDGNTKTTEGLRQWAWYADTTHSKIKKNRRLRGLLVVYDCTSDLLVLRLFHQCVAVGPTATPPASRTALPRALPSNGPLSH